MNRQDLTARAFGALVRDAADHPVGEADSWIRRATQRINSELRVGEMVMTEGYNLGGRLTPLPDDFLHPISVRLGANRLPLIYASPTELAVNAARTTRDGRPGYFTTRGRELEIFPWADGNGALGLELVYFAKVPALGPDPSSTNWLLDDHEDLFLNAVLIYGHRFWMEDDRALLKEGLVAQEIARHNDKYSDAKYGDGPLVMTPSRKLGGRRS